MKLEQLNEGLKFGQKEIALVKKEASKVYVGIEFEYHCTKDTIEDGCRKYGGYDAIMGRVQRPEQDLSYPQAPTGIEVSDDTENPVVGPSPELFSRTDTPNAARRAAGIAQYLLVLQEFIEDMGRSNIPSIEQVWDSLAEEYAESDSYIDLLRESASDYFSYADEDTIESYTGHKEIGGYYYDIDDVDRWENEFEMEYTGDDNQLDADREAEALSRWEDEFGDMDEEDDDYEEFDYEEIDWFPRDASYSHIEELFIDTYIEGDDGSQAYDYFHDGSEQAYYEEQYNVEDVLAVYDEINDPGLFDHEELNRLYEVFLDVANSLRSNAPYVEKLQKQLIAAQTLEEFRDNFAMSEMLDLMERADREWDYGDATAGEKYNFWLEHTSLDFEQNKWRRFNALDHQIFSSLAEATESDVMQGFDYDDYQEMIDRLHGNRDVGTDNAQIDGFGEELGRELNPFIEITQEIFDRFANIGPSDAMRDRMSPNHVRRAQSHLPNQPQTTEDARTMIENLVRREGNPWGIDPDLIEKVIIDPSVSPGVETVTFPFPLRDLHEILPKFLKHIDEVGYTSEKAGMHVNLSVKGKNLADTSQFSPIKAVALTNEFFAHEGSSGGTDDNPRRRPIIGFKPRRYVNSIMMDMSITQINAIATKFMNDPKRDLGKIVQDALMNESRYRTVNIKKTFEHEEFDVNKRRIEFRYFGGTDYEKRLDDLLWGIYRASFFVLAGYDKGFGEKEYKTALVKMLDTRLKQLKVDGSKSFSEIVRNLNPHPDALGRVESRYPVKVAIALNDRNQKALIFLESMDTPKKAVIDLKTHQQAVGYNDSSVNGLNPSVWKITHNGRGIHPNDTLHRITDVINSVDADRNLDWNDYDIMWDSAKWRSFRSQARKIILKTFGTK